MWIILIADYNQKKRSALHWATYEGQTEAVRALIDAKADVNMADQVCKVICSKGFRK